MKKAAAIMLGMVLLTTAVQAQYRNLEIQAAGLTCSLCSNAILKALKGLPYVQNVETDLKTNLFSVQLRSGFPVDFDMITRKVEEAGFSVGRMTVEVKFSPAEIKNDAHIVNGNQVFHFLAVQPQKIEGWHKVKLMDKQFVLSAEAKKNSKLTQMACYTTGITGSCCTTGNVPAGRRVYHVTL